MCVVVIIRPFCGDDENGLCTAQCLYSTVSFYDDNDVDYYYDDNDDDYYYDDDDDDENGLCTAQCLYSTVSTPKRRPQFPPHSSSKR